VQAGKDFLYEKFNPQILWQFMLIQLTELLYVWIFVLFYCLILLTQNYVIEIDKSLLKLYFASVSLDAGLNCNKKNTEI
jgi:hypothetical protein